MYLQKLEELKRSQEEELEERLDAGVKRILAANRRMAEELRLHVTVSMGCQHGDAVGMRLLQQACQLSMRLAVLVRLLFNRPGCMLSWMPHPSCPRVP